MTVRRAAPPQASADMLPTSRSTSSPARSHTRDHGPTTAHTSRSTGSTGGDDELLELPLPKKQACLHAINRSVAAVLASMVGDRPSTVYWKPKGRKKDVAFFVDDNVNPDQYRFCCVSETRARTEDVMRLFLMTDTETLLKNCRVVYNNVLAARVLGVLERPTRARPFRSVYLRYSSFATAPLLDDRDMCLVVATDVFTHADGSTIGYCLWDSVELPECPDDGKRGGVVRSRMFRSGFFCRTTSGSGSSTATTKIVYLVGLEPGGVAPRLTARLVMDRFGANLARLCEHFRRKHLDPATFRPRREWAAKRDAKGCGACPKTFGSFSTRHHCAACGGVFCGPCCTKEKVDLPGVGFMPMRFCRACLGVRGLAVVVSSSSPSSAYSKSGRRRIGSQSGRSLHAGGSDSLLRHSHARSELSIGRS